MDDPPSAPLDSVGDPFKAARPNPPIFQSASSVLKSSSGSLRNASGGTDPDQPPTNINAESTSASTTQATEETGSSSSAEQSGAAVLAPVKPVHRSASSKNAIVYSAVQRRNPVLHAIKNVPTEIGDIPADYQVGTHNGVLFLSLKYHRLHPEYIHQRIEKMKKMYNLRILMILCDVSEHQQSLRELTKIAIINDLSTFVAWSNDEIAQYITTFKQYEHKSADTLKERVHQVYSDQLQHVLTSGKKVNKTDAHNLASQFGSFAEISQQGPKALAGVKGLGPTKVNSLVDAFSKPFLVGGLKRQKTGSSTSELVNGGNEAAIAEVGVVNGEKNGDKGEDKGKGKEKALVDSREMDDIGEGEMEDNPESPIEGHNDDDDDEDEDGPVDWPLSPGRGRIPSQSRSPGLSPEPRNGVGDKAWKDPLEDEEEDEGEEGGQNGERREGKRQRTA